LASIGSTIAPMLDGILNQQARNASASSAKGARECGLFAVVTRGNEKFCVENVAMQRPDLGTLDMSMRAGGCP